MQAEPRRAFSLIATLLSAACAAPPDATPPSDAATRATHLADVTAPGWTPLELDEAMAWLD
ncbi:MAG: hypothetical protein KAI24_18400, partial [Planctomycetes bacterium]|nr:hypothetical protein [Planctomycetota bacterium]